MALTCWAFLEDAFSALSVGWLESQTRNYVLLVFSLADHYHVRLFVRLTAEGLGELLPEIPMQCKGGDGSFTSGKFSQPRHFKGFKPSDTKPPPF